MPKLNIQIDLTLEAIDDVAELIGYKELLPKWETDAEGNVLPALDENGDQILVSNPESKQKTVFTFLRAQLGKEVERTVFSKKRVDFLQVKEQEERELRNQVKGQIAIVETP